MLISAGLSHFTFSLQNRERVDGFNSLELVTVQ